MVNTLGVLLIVSRRCACKDFPDVYGAGCYEHGAGPDHQRLLHKVQSGLILNSAWEGNKNGPKFKITARCVANCVTSMCLPGSS